MISIKIDTKNAHPSAKKTKNTLFHRIAHSRAESTKNTFFAFFFHFLKINEKYRYLGRIMEICGLFLAYKDKKRDYGRQRIVENEVLEKNSRNRKKAKKVL